MLDNVLQEMYNIYKLKEDHPYVQIIADGMNYEGRMISDVEYLIALKDEMKDTYPDQEAAIDLITITTPTDYVYMKCISKSTRCKYEYWKIKMASITSWKFFS